MSSPHTQLGLPETSCLISESNVVSTAEPPAPEWEGLARLHQRSCLHVQGGGFLLKEEDGEETGSEREPLHHTPLARPRQLK